MAIKDFTDYQNIIDKIEKIEKQIRGNNYCGNGIDNEMVERAINGSTTVQEIRNRIDKIKANKIKADNLKSYKIVVIIVIILVICGVIICGFTKKSLSIALISIGFTCGLYLISISGVEEDKGALEKLAKEEALEKEINRIRRNVEKELILKEKIKLEKEIKEFENKLQRLSDSFAENEFVKKVVEEMVDWFYGWIIKADRSSKEKTITEFLGVSVDSREIIICKYRSSWSYYNNFEYSYSFPYFPYCDQKRYIFEDYRLRNLVNELEQIALNRAIVMGIQSYMHTKHPKDLSGTDFSFNISYKEEHGKYYTIIQYYAQNGYYKEVQDWI